MEESYQEMPIELMTLKRIVIKKLFHRLDYEIPLDRQKRVSLVYGLNGSGKTTILRLLHSVSRVNLAYLTSTPFQKIILEFKEGTVEISRQSRESSTILIDSRIEGERVSLSVSPMTERFVRHFTSGRFAPLRQTRLDEFGEMVWSRFKPNTSSEKIKQWLERGFDLADGYEREMVVEVLKHLGDFRTKKQREETPLKIVNHLSRIPCYLLPATRLWEEVPGRDRVAICADELKDRLGKVKDRLTRESQSLDYAFPKKALDWTRAERTRTTSGLSVSAARERFEQRYQELEEMGLLQGEEAIVFSESDVKEMEEKLGPVLAAHYDNLEKKLSVLDDIYPDISLLIQTVEGFYGNTMSIKADYERGLVAIPQDADSPIPVASMSSGQQHILILAYDLIFEVNEDQLVMIDEPELSLHTLWQKILVERLRRIGDERDIQFLLATHSSLIYRSAKSSAVELVAFR